MRIDGGTLIRGWGNWLRAGGTRQTTVYLYERYVMRLGDVFDLVTVTGRQIAAWMADHEWKPETRKSCRTAIRSFFGWAQAEGFRQDDPTIGLRSVRLPPPCPRPVTDALWLKALTGADDETRLMVLLAGLAGLRRAEIAGLHTNDLDDDVLRIKGKAGRVRVIPIDSQELLAELRAIPEGWVFPGRFPGTHVCPDYVGRRLSRVLGPGWTGHKLRHRFASRAFRGTRNLLAVQALLGHSSSETTRRYVLIDEEDLREAVHAVSLAHIRVVA